MTSKTKEELFGLVNDLRAHLVWLRENGVREVAAGREHSKKAITDFRGVSADSSPLSRPSRPEVTFAEKESGPVSLRAAVRAAVDSKSGPLNHPKASKTSNSLEGVLPPAPGAPVPELAPEKHYSLDEIQKVLGDCQRCKLARSRNKIVFGAGNPQAKLVFVGEGPGEEEDVRGLPFVGAAGQLLSKMIEAMGLTREDVYICNIVKCRPPGNRNPENDEIESCSPFLKAQLASISPKVIVALGKFAAQTLLQEKTPISRLRGNWREYGGIKLMPTFHPSYLLRSPSEKRKAWEDLQMVMKELGIRKK